ncbi:carbon-nitrogen hydrolase family protein, partial [Streptomyces sp. NPDC020125]|uniref:carbon-nitrogen hydrolase family protein n=1 Tax=Streptomyces sp. NPDC020125 TaxID=3154593 RepID=UPI0033E3ABFD
MKASIAIAQIPITWDIERNLAAITSLLANVHPDEIVVLPEGALSGYGTDLSALEPLHPSALEHAMDCLAELAQRRAIHLFCGTLLFEHDAWSNAALYFSPDGTRWTYRKINLAMNERGRLEAGSELSTLPIHLASGPVTLG